MCYSLRFLTILIILVLSMGATKNGEAQILVGPKAGLQYGWLNLENDSDKEYITSTPALGMFAGVTGIVNVENQFFLHMELLYTYRQQVITGKADADLRDTQSNHFLELPITYEMHFQSHLGKRPYSLFLGAGPNVSYWLFGKGKIRTSELIESNNSPLRYDVYFTSFEDGVGEEGVYIGEANRFQLGINFSTGVTFTPAQGSLIILEGRFDYGHSYMARSDYGYYPGLLDYSLPLQTNYLAIRASITYVFDTKVAERKKGKSTQKKS